MKKMSNYRVITLLKFLAVLSCCFIIIAPMVFASGSGKGNVTFIAKAVPSSFTDQIELVYKLRETDTTVSTVLTFVSGYRSSEKINYGNYDLISAKVIGGNTNIEYEVTATPMFASHALGDSFVEVTVIASRMPTPQPAGNDSGSNVTVQKLEGGVKIFGKDGILKVQSWPTLILAIILGGILVYNKFRKSL